MPIKLGETDEINFYNKRQNIWTVLKFLYYFLSFISIIILIVIMITLFVLLNKYGISCDGIKDEVIVCYITEWKNYVNEPNYLVKFVNRYCPLLWK